MRTIITVVAGLTCSNLFMTFAWYGTSEEHEIESLGHCSVIKLGYSLV